MSTTPTSAPRRRRLGKEISRVFRLSGISQVVSYLRQVLRRAPLIEIKVRGLASPLFVRPDQTDLEVLWGAFGKRECELSPTQPPLLIIDGGANAGYTTVFFAAKYPAAQVIAVEPDAANCAMIRRNCQAYSNVRVIEAALWNKRTTLQITNPDVACWSFQVGEVSHAQPGTMQGITVPDLLAQSGRPYIDILKLDIEGAEEQLFADGAHTWIDRVQLLLIEIHGPAAEQAVFKVMQARKFNTSRQQEKFLFTKIEPTTAAS